MPSPSQVSAFVTRKVPSRCNSRTAYAMAPPVSIGVCSTTQATSRPLSKPSRSSCRNLIIKSAWGCSRNTYDDTPCLIQFSICRCKNGISPMGAKALGTSLTTAFKRVPKPPASTSILIGRPLDETSGPNEGAHHARRQSSDTKRPPAPSGYPPQTANFCLCQRQYQPEYRLACPRSV